MHFSGELVFIQCLSSINISMISVCPKYVNLSSRQAVYTPLVSSTDYDNCMLLIRGEATAFLLLPHLHISDILISH